jgi:hypothetical protein
VPGVAAVTVGAVAQEVIADLDETEALFIRAWASRRGGLERPRPGEGLDWDAGGFEPPDATGEVEPAGREATGTEDE